MNKDEPINLPRRRIATLSIGTGVALSLPMIAAARTAATTSTIPDSLETWVAKDGQEPTVVQNPCYVDDLAASDLAFYHPMALDSRRYRFKHVAARDESGRPYARVESISDNWNEKFAEVMLALKLYPERINGIDLLIDRQIRNANTRLMHGWKVTEWMVVKNLGAHLEVSHQDFIVWEKSGQVARSGLCWKVYKSAGEA